MLQSVAADQHSGIAFGAGGLYATTVEAGKHLTLGMCSKDDGKCPFALESQNKLCLKFGIPNRSFPHIFINGSILMTINAFRVEYRESRFREFRESRRFNFTKLIFISLQAHGDWEKKCEVSVVVT